MGFAAGFNAGWQAVDSGRKNRRDKEDRAKQEAIDKELRSIYEIDPQRIESTTPSNEQMQRYDAENARTAAADAATFGTDASAQDYRYGAPQTAEPVARYGINGVEADTPEDARAIATERVLAKNGLYKDAAGMRRERTQNRAAEIQLSGAERQQRKQESADALDQEIARITSDTGKPPGTQAIMQVAGRLGVDTDTLHDRLLKTYDITKRQAIEVADKKKAELRAAMAKGPDAMLAMHDPDPSDNIKPTFSNVNGRIMVMYGDKPLFGDMTFKDHIELGGYMESLIDKDPIAYTAALKDQELKRAELQSKIDENTAQADSARASAESSRAQAKKHIADASKTNTEADRLKKGLGNNTDPKVEANEVSSALGAPALNPRTGKPIYDPVTGRQQINRNMAEEDAFYRWMAKSGITDTNAGLLRWKSGERDTAMPKPVAAKPSKPFNPGDFMK